MNQNWSVIDSYQARASQQQEGLLTPPSFDYTPPITGGHTASTGVEELPEEFFRLKDAARRGELDIVQTIWETERLPNTPMERLSNESLNSVLHGAILEGRTHVATYLLSQGVPWKTIQIEVALMKGLNSLL
jgi:hypothetical protein